MTSTSSKLTLDPSTQAFYKRTLGILAESGIPFMLGGAYALAQYMDFERHTRDLDIFCYRKDAQAILDLLSKAGYKTEMLFPHWLGKAFSGEEYIDVIFSSGNGIAEVDEETFLHAKDGTILDIPVKVMPAEEIIWSKAFIMERERFDGADVAHLIRACGTQLDWKRLLRRFGEQNYRVLLSQLIMFGFVYPGHQDQVPDWVMRELLNKVASDLDKKPEDKNTCYGTLLSRAQYLVDTDNWGYADARLLPVGNMNGKDIAHWTAAIEK